MDAFLAAIQQYGVTWVYVVPPIVVALVKSAGQGGLVVLRMKARCSRKRMTRIMREQGVLTKQGVRTVPLPC